MLRARLWNGQRPDPQGAAVRADQQRGQPRRGRQGVLLLPRLDAHALVHAYLYKYPQAAFPYDEPGQRRTARATAHELEYELLDTGIFDDDRYFDVFVEYAKAAPEDILVRITVANRGPEAATIHLLPTLWFRNTWALEAGPRPAARWARSAGVRRSASHAGAGRLRASTAEGNPELLFTENETNTERLWRQPNATPYVKDAFHRYVVDGERDAVNPSRSGTKAAAHYVLDVPAGGESVVRLRLTRRTSATGRRLAIRRGV